jgi:hypothetical protein
MAQPADQIVGRAAELESLDRALAELERRRSCVLELVGEPGGGRDRDAVVRELRRLGRPVHRRTRPGRLFHTLGVSSRVAIDRTVERAGCEVGGVQP